MDSKDVSWEREGQFHLIEVVAYWEGRVTTDHLMRAFGFSSRTTGGKVFREYQRRTGNNLTYAAHRKGYVPGYSFRFCFSHGDMGEYLNLMSRHATLNPSFAGVKDLPAPTEFVEAPHRAVAPEIVRQVVAATQKRSRLEVSYRSHTSPEGEERIIAPHTLVYTGQRWHARAWCEKHRDFRDFVLTRIDAGIEERDEALPEAAPELDHRWNEQIEIILAPNPSLTLAQQRMVAMDYGIESEGEIHIPVRKALAHYFLLSLNIFLESERFKAEEQPLVVINRNELKPFVFG